MAHDYAIITPTYRPHFKYVGNYLESYTHYVTSGKVPIYFVISRDEAAEFELIIDPYRSYIEDINVLLFEDILFRFGVSSLPMELLDRHGRFTFQTMKKMYAMLAVDAERFLVLDSESMWGNPTDMCRVFADFFAAPFLSGTSLDAPFRTSADFNLMCENINFLLGFECRWWLLENFVWFYEKRILSDLFAERGTLIDMAERLFARNDSLPGLRDIKNGIFEIQLYQAFVWFNREKYGYRFNDCMELLEEALGKTASDKYLAEFHRCFNGHCGVMEHAMLLLDELNTAPLASLFKNLRFNIIRCERVERYFLQRRFMNIAQPAILAASQDHLFGLNAAPAVRSAKAMEKAEKHFREFLSPFHKTLKWIAEPFAALLYLLKAAVWRVFGALCR